MYLEFSMFLIFPPPQHCVLHHLIKNIFINYTSSLRNTYILTYYAIWQRTVAHPATQFQATSQNKGFEAQIHNTERNAASQTDHGITLPLNQPPISGKQLISSHSADQNQAMLYNIYFPPENISVAGLSIFPSGNNTSGQTYTLDTQQKNKQSTQDVGLNDAARKCWKCEKEGCRGRIRKDWCTNACGSCGSKECKGKESRHLSYP